jgi:RNA-directed DNA polymerase
MRNVMTRLGLSINEAKTALRNARQERFDFLGYSFGLHWQRANGDRFLGASPSKKSILRVQDKLRKILQPSNPGTWQDIRDRLNHVLRGWSVYFAYGSVAYAHRAVNWHVENRVRGFLQRRHELPSRGTRRFPTGRIFGELGVHRISRSVPDGAPYAFA